MIGIYKITNKITRHAYIGKSVNIEARLKSHFRRASLDCEQDVEYNKALYRAIRKYGKDNFEVEILEELFTRDRKVLDAREIYWISFYDTYNNGYNATLGGEGVSGIFGEQHHNHKVTEADVKDIRYRYAACIESVQDIYEDYSDKIQKSGFKKIYSWETWPTVLADLNTEEVKLWHKNNARLLYSFPNEKNPRSKLSDQIVLYIRQRYHNGETMKNLYEEYKNCGMSLGSFRNLICGHTRKTLSE